MATGKNKDRFMADMPIRDKMVFAFSLVMLLIALMVAMHYYQLNKIRAYSQEVIPQAQRMAGVFELFEDVDQVVSVSEGIIAAPSSSDRYDSTASIEHCLASARRVQDAYGDGSGDIARVETILVSLESEMGSFIDYRESNPSLASTSPQLQAVNSSISSLQGLTIVLRQESMQGLYSNVRTQNDVINDIAFQSLVLGAFVLLGGMLIMILISKRISSPILRLKDSAGNIAKGDLETPIVAESRDEVGELAKAFEDMRIGLKDRSDLLETILGSLKGKMGKVASVLLSNDITALIRRNPRIRKIIPEELGGMIAEGERMEKSMSRRKRG